MSEAIEIPEYFICPISLQIMRDPVTTTTGITYDRESIERWILTSSLCPATKQELARGSDLTPNHMLRRLIQAWCVANPNSGLEQIPTPKYPVHRSVVTKLARDVNNAANDVTLSLSSLDKLHELANEDEKNQKFMSEFGVAKAMIHYILRSCYKGKQTLGLDRALRVLQLTWAQTAENKLIVQDNLDLIESMLWTLNIPLIDQSTKTSALAIMQHVTELASPNLMQKLATSNTFFELMIRFLQKSTFPQDTKAVLKILIQTSPYGRNRSRIVELGAIFILLEIELNGPDKRTTELIFGLLASLCSIADGRQQLLKHAGGLALVGKRILRVSNVTDDRALCVLESIARFSATREVVLEMLRFGAVTKLCMVLQADCDSYLKKKAREILRLHSSVWGDSACIQVYLLTRYK